MWRPGPSSSCWVRDPSFARFVDDSFAALRREVPEAHLAMCGALAPRVLRFEVDDEVAIVRFGCSDVIAVPAATTPAVALRTTRVAILSVIDGEHSLV